MGKKEFELVTYWLLQKAYGLKESLEMEEESDTKKEMVSYIDEYIDALKNRFESRDSIEYLLKMKEKK